MKKYLSILYIAIGVFSYGQFSDNSFENNNDEGKYSSYVEHSSNYQKSNQVYSNNNQDNGGSGTNSLSGPPIGGEQEEGPGNPGPPVPIDGSSYMLFISGAILMVYFHKRLKKVNI